MKISFSGKFIAYLIVVMLLSVNAFADSTTVAAPAPVSVEKQVLTKSGWESVIVNVPPAPVSSEGEGIPAQPVVEKVKPVSKGGMWLKIQSLIGVIMFLGIGFAISNNRRAINWRTIGVGLALQLAMALIVFRTPLGFKIAEGARSFVAKLLSFTDAGASFMFGGLYNASPDAAKSLGAHSWQVLDAVTGQPFELGMFFATHVLPTIIFFASLMAVLYHLGIMQLIVGAFAWVMTRLMKVSGAESLSCSANIFVGQTEAPFLVKPFLGNMTNSEIMAVMTGGFATVAGGVMAAYVRFGIDAGQLLTASVMNAPGALVMAKLIFPETGTPVTAGKSANAKVENLYSNVIDAAAAGASDGMKLAINVMAMLIAFIALIAMIDGGLGWLGGFIGHPEISLKILLGWIFAPIAWGMGVQSDEIIRVASLLGTKISINEFVAYIELAGLAEGLTPRSIMLATFALCGFANFSSIAIQVGGISALVPERRTDLAAIGFKAMVAGALVNCTTAAIAGVIFAS